MKLHSISGTDKQLYNVRSDCAQNSRRTLFLQLLIMPKDLETTCNMQKESINSTMDAKGFEHYVSGSVNQTAVFSLIDSIVHELSCFWSCQSSCRN
jgi:hypothetical protein